MIEVDRRSGSSDLIPILKKIAKPHGVKVVTSTLNSADVAWVDSGDHSWGIEVKHIPDLLQSMQNGRFVSQLRRMQKEYAHYALMVVDEFKARTDGELEFRKMYNKFIGGWVAPLGFRNSQLGYYGLIGWLTTMYKGAGCEVVTVQNNIQAAHWIYARYRWSIKREDQHKSLQVFDTSRPAPRRDTKGVKFIGKPNGVAKLANALVEGIGWTKAKALGSHYNSPDEFWSAGMKSLMKVKGIGKELAGRIVEARTRRVR